MFIHGREVGFRMTVGATLEIAKLTPHQSIEEIGDVLSEATFAGQVELVAAFIAAMSRGDEEARKYETPGYVPHPLTVGEILSLDMKQLWDLQAAALAAYNGDSEVTVETEESKKEEAPPGSA